MAAELQRPPLPYKGRLPRGVSDPSAPPANPVNAPRNANGWFTSNYTIHGGVLLEGLSNFCKEGENLRTASPAAMESYLSTYIIDAFHALVLTQSAEGKSLHTIDMLLNHLKGKLTDIFGYLYKLEAGDIGYTLFLSELLGYKIDGLTARKLLELRTPEEQCDYSIGPFIDGTLCYICHLPITTEQHFAGECEHILAVPDALFHTQLYQIKTNILNYGVYDQGLIKSEYKWAHRCCNRGKNDRRFMKRSSDGTRYVIADGFTDGINKTFDIMHSWKGPKNPSKYSSFIMGYGSDNTWAREMKKTRLFGKPTSSHNCNEIFPTTEFNSIRLTNLVPYINPIVDTINSHLDVIKETKQVGRVDAMLIYSMLTIFRFLIRLFHNPDLLVAFHRKFILDGSEDNQVSISRPDPSTFEKVVNASNILYSKVDNKIKKVRTIDNTNTIRSIDIDRRKVKLIAEDMLLKRDETAYVNTQMEGIKEGIKRKNMLRANAHNGGMVRNESESESESKMDTTYEPFMGTIFQYKIENGVKKPNLLYNMTHNMITRSKGSATFNSADVERVRKEYAESVAAGTKSSLKGNMRTVAESRHLLQASTVEELTSFDAETCCYVTKPDSTYKIFNDSFESEKQIGENIRELIGDIDDSVDESRYDDPWIPFRSTAASGSSGGFKKHATRNQQGGEQYVDPYAIIQLDFPTELAFLHLLAYRRVYLEIMNLETISTEQYINTPGILTMALEHAGYHADPRFEKLLERDHIVTRSRNNRKRLYTRRQMRHRSHMGHSTARRPHTGRSTARRPHKHHSTARHTLKRSTPSSLRV